MKDVDKDIVLKAVISKIKKESNPKYIKVKGLKDFDSPSSIKSHENDGEEGFVPDIEVNYELSTNLYEIELEDGNPVDKWQVFADYAKKNKGHLYIVAPDYLKDKIKNEITNKGFNAGLIYFST